MIKPKIRIRLRVLSASEGGREVPITDSRQYRPHLVIEEDLDAVRYLKSISGLHFMGVHFEGRGDSLEPGPWHEVEVTLMYWPRVDYRTLRKGALFSMREGPRAVAVGDAGSDGNDPSTAPKNTAIMIGDSAN